MWAGYLGPETGERLKHALGKDAQITTGPGYGLGVQKAPGEPARLTVSEKGQIRAVIGDEVEAGCSVTIDTDGAALLQRDRFGLHSVYTARRGEHFWFASNLQTLVRCLDAVPALSPQALHGYLCFSYVPVPQAIYTDVMTLPAGGRVRVMRDQSEETYTHSWHEGTPFGGSEDEAVAQLRRLLREAIERKLEAEREVGVFLSGGLDSSLIAALLVEAGARFHLLTLDFGSPWNAELPFAQQVAAHLKTPITVVEATPKAVRTALEAAGAALEQPFGDGVVVPLMLLGLAASGQVETIFNGEGGDQLFGGWANKPMIAAEMYGGVGYDRETAYLETFHRFYGLADLLYSPRMKTLTADVKIEDWVRPALDAGKFSSLLHRLRAANLMLKGAQNIAPRSVQLAAAQGLKVRSPFFDSALTEWSFGLPPEWLLQGACEKYLLKRVAEAYLPAEIVWREKRGMGVPTTEWCLGPLRRDLTRALNPRRLKREDLFDPRYVASLCRGEDQPGEFRRRRVGEKLWTLWMFQNWRENRKL